MKIRTDFVTNSSSSSYVVVLDSEYLEPFLRQATPLIKKVFERFSNENLFMGRNITILSYSTGNDSSFEYGFDEFHSYANVGDRIEQDFLYIPDEIDKFLNQLDSDKKVVSREDH